MALKEVVLVVLGGLALAAAVQESSKDDTTFCEKIGGQCTFPRRCETEYKQPLGCTSPKICCKTLLPGLPEGQSISGRQGGICSEKSRCSNNGGECVQRECTGDESTLENACKGSGCNCCIGGCVRRDRCIRLNGRCTKGSCGAGERVVRNACKDPDCTCCADAKPCKTFTKCSRRGGTCVKASECDEANPDTDGCKRGCVCCGATCTPRRRCNDRGGTCIRTDCAANEKVIVNACKDKSCTCCAPKACKTLKKCKKWGGTCTLPGACDIAGADGIGCQKKKGCVCCTDGCKPKNRCEKKGGSCVKRKCSSDEKEVKKGCMNPDCSCCIPQQCKTKNKCKGWGGTCVPPGECEFTGVDSVGCRAKGSDCVCCTDDCRATDQCTEAGGSCVTGNCGAGFVEIADGCLKPGCTCCAPSVCDETGVACSEIGGTCVSSGECTLSGTSNAGCGAGCVCCFEECAIQPSCTAERGTCRQECLAGEGIVEGGCTGAGCICCTPARAQCPTTDTCDGKCIDERDCSSSDVIANAECSGEFCTCCIDCVEDAICTAMRGTCRQSCLQGEEIVEDGCSGFGCTCCRPADVPCDPTPDTCPGKCVDDRTCPAGELIADATCTGEFCVCCLDCEVLPNCIAQRGTCRQTCLEGEEILEDGCSGSGCTCCIPPLEQCPATETCPGQCLDNRACNEVDVIPDANCAGEFCTCCIDCTARASCSAQRGTCRQTCLEGEDTLKGGCSGSGCKCCTPPSEVCPATPGTCEGKCVDIRDCSSADVITNSVCTGEFCTCCLDCTKEPSCAAERGTCRQTCLEGEEILEDGCSGLNCKCCTPPPEVCPATPSTCEGKCVDSRDCSSADLIPDSVCTGEFCTCCLDCTAETTCTDQEGTCKGTCAEGETEIDNGCTGVGCKCCSPPIRECAASSTCPGKCVDNRECETVIAGTCGDEGCVCCLDCTPNPPCSRRGGACKQECAEDETLLEDGCTGNGCKCCIPNANLVCDATPNTCIGTCLDSIICDEEIPDSSCTGEDCKCCRDCNPINDCADLDSYCTSGECPNGRVHIIDGCSGVGCKCCSTTAGLQSCPKSPGCVGRCRDRRACPVEMLNSQCDKDGCVCCLNCDDNGCEAANGVCRERGTCLENETEDPAKCTGNRCICCIATADVQGGFSDTNVGGVGGPGVGAAESDAALVINCGGVVCNEPEGDDCVQVNSFGECCSNWLCGDVPSACIAQDGTPYEIGTSWSNDCEYCYCYYTSEGAMSNCYKFGCIPPPHRDCVTLEVEGECCPDYFCSGTTCKTDYGKYYGIDETWIEPDDPCTSCTCVDEGDGPTIQCVVSSCPAPPSPECVPLGPKSECCATSWDCTNTYLITATKNWVRGGTSSVCVFLVEEPPVTLDLTMRLVVGEETSEGVLTTEATERQACVDVQIPEGTDGTGTLEVAGTVGSVSITQKLDVSLVSIRETFIQTDKYLYLPGQVVQFRILTVVGATAQVSYDNLEEVWLLSPKQTRLAQWLDVDNSQGLVHLEFPLADHVEEGTYTIRAKTNGLTTSQTFKVEPYVLPRFEVVVTPPSYVLVSETIILFEVCADYVYGQPLTGSGTMSVSRLYYPFEEQLTEPLVVDIPTFTGCTSVEVDTSQIDIGGFRYNREIVATAEITEEGTTNQASAFVNVVLERQLISFERLSKEMDVKPGLPLLVKMQATYPDKSPAPDLPVTVCVRDICKDFVTDSSGIFSPVVPSHIVTTNDNLQVTITDEEPPAGHLGQLITSLAFLYFEMYFSPSGSSLSLDLPTDPVDCTEGQGVTLTLPVFFVANGMDAALLRVQVISRSQVVFADSVDVDFVESSLGLVEDDFLAPLEVLGSEFTRGVFSITVDIPYFASPTVHVLIWYDRPDGEVVADSGIVDVSKCLPNTAGIAFSPSEAAPKDSMTITLTSAADSICSLSVVDRSVEILSRGQTGRLTKTAIFNILEKTEPSIWENSQIDDGLYCSGDETSNYYDFFWRPRAYSIYKDSLTSFNGAGALVVSDLTLETRPCILPDYNYDYIAYGLPAPGAGAEYDYDGVPEGAGPPIEESEGEDTATTSEDVQEARSYFPETWLFEIVVIENTGSKSLQVDVPDTITEWVGEAVCLNPVLGIGLAPPTTFTAFTSFFLDLVLPPTVRRGEQVPISLSVFNYMNIVLPVSIVLSESSMFTATEYTKSVCVEPNNKGVVVFTILASEAGDVELTFSASVSSDVPDCVSGGILPIKSDVLIRTLKVVFEGVVRENVNSVFICGDGDVESWDLESPEDIIEGSEFIYASATADIMGPTLDNLDHLISKPYGCGEQNMIGFVPNIYALQYLTAIDDVSAEVQSAAIANMISGYQRELTYRHSDGSYSAFGESDPEGSTWLTAYVLKSFAGAAEYITIDEDDLTVSADWLQSLQTEDGCFQSLGTVHHKSMKGGLEASSSSPIPLAAYITIALAEAGKLEGDVLTNAVGCITSDTETGNLYSEALKGYALAYASPSDAQAHIDAAYDLVLSGVIVEDTILVESMAYILLAMVKSDPLGYVPQAVDIVKRITTMRNSNGGFISTQDTVVSLQALAAYSEAFPASSVDLTLAVTALASNFLMIFNEDNSRVLQTHIIEETLPYTVSVTPSGQGCAVFMVVHKFNKPQIIGIDAFDLTVSSSTTDCSPAQLTVCTSYLLEDGASNMAIIELDLESGYSAIEDDLQGLVTKGDIKRYEQPEAGLVNLYLDSITSTQICLTLGVQRYIIVGDIKPGTVTVYDYYENDMSVAKTLQIDKTGC